MNNQFSQLLSNTNSNVNSQLNVQNQNNQFERVSVQIIPKTRELTKIMKENKHSAFIELSLRSNKTLKSIIRHLNKKWKCGNKQEGTFPNKMYRLKLFPVNLNFPQGFDLTNSHQITIDFLYKQLQVNTLQIEYVFEIYLEPLRRKKHLNSLPVISSLSQDLNQDEKENLNCSKLQPKGKARSVNSNNLGIKPLTRRSQRIKKINKSSKNTQNAKRKKRIRRFLIIGKSKRFEIGKRSKGKNTSKTAKSKKPTLKRNNTESFQRKRKYCERTYSLPITVNLEPIQNKENQPNENETKKQPLKKEETEPRITIKTERPTLKQNNTNTISIKKENKNCLKKKRLNDNKTKTKNSNKTEIKKDTLHPLSNFLGLLGSINKNEKQQSITTPIKAQASIPKQTDILHSNTNSSITNIILNSNFNNNIKKKFNQTQNQNPHAVNKMKKINNGSELLQWKTPRSFPLQRITDSMRTKTFLIPNEEISQDSFNLGKKTQSRKLNTPMNENSMDTLRRYNFEDSFQYYPEQVTNQIFSPSLDSHSLFCSPSLPFGLSNHSYLNSPSQQLLISPLVVNSDNSEISLNKSKLSTSNFTNGNFNDREISLDLLYKSPSLNRMDPNHSPSPSKLLKKKIFIVNNENVKLNKNFTNSSNYNKNISISTKNKKNANALNFKKLNVGENNLTNFKRMLNRFDQELLPTSPSSSSSSLF
ncbi:hypothetical protein M0813_04770 [Anaeramoeba flamelloides]|uniref:Uncharacterized protein n=1 Tax=Anaeramoeba flamelloides TaxID=1746091 RepID=A0ABQ8XIS6_9EUKA|nr:hypothetical protein M0813_04770 [Anaeramoeba flamelloides]